ncbi:MAG TPA: BlaI/MecI/CopY family transcriptional regulator [Pirellulales bacterium]|nr:BlaI/MecI/CopY family transcriptional regulator [Pirellulales bacterium]
MAGRKEIAITDRQFAVLEVLWERGPLSVRQLMKHLPGKGRQPYTTVLGMLQNMERAGLVTHDEAAGNAYEYRPLIDKKQATGTLLDDFVRRFFRGSIEALLAGLVDSEALSPAELKDIERRFAQAEQSKTPTASKRRKKNE